MRRAGNDVRLGSLADIPDHTDDVGMSTCDMSATLGECLLSGRTPDPLLSLDTALGRETCYALPIVDPKFENDRNRSQLGDVMPQDQKFEIPQELRQLAEENVERARQLYVQFMDGVGQTMAAWSSASSDVVAPGYREVQEHAVKLANENADAAFRLAKNVAQAKDLHELIDLQTRYVQSQMKWYAEQTQEFGRLMTRALGDMKKGQS